jgi:hypothetical protein
MADSLSKTQQALLEAIKAGARVSFVNGGEPHWVRYDTFATCTQLAKSLLKKGAVTESAPGRAGSHLIAAQETE